MPTFRTRVALAATAVAALALLVVPAAPAVAAPSVGWVRVAHLSPDTKTVDVRLAPLSGGGEVLAVDDVSYGAVSKYLAVPAGEYAVAMRPAGASASSTPVVQTSVDVEAGGASTVSVFGRNADLETRVIEDALTLPKAGLARVRVVQASTGPDPVTVTAAPDTTILADAAITTVSRYADVKAGTWRLTATQGSDSSTTTVDLAAGQVASILVLDDASGGVVLRRVLDSASVGGVPKGYLATGGGYLAHETAQLGWEHAAAASALGGSAVLASVLLLRRRNRARA